ncbi:MAG TPA: DUF4242 domain-containing protein [Dehalococcoidia bacterium]|nr:DUF4242 domain-containing protein [Dehalococcoidia bacterium]
MGLHKLKGITIEQAHEKDAAVQEEFGVNLVFYWFNEAAGNVFCLVEADSVNDVVATHKAPDDLTTDEIIEVSPGKSLIRCAVR